MSEKMIQRAFTSDVEARKGSEDELRVRGHAAVFDSPTIIGSRRYGYVEQIRAGAFDGRLDDDARYLENHGGAPFARVKNGTVNLSLDGRGLVVDADLNPNMQSARDHHAAIERGDIDAMSFAFTILEDEVEQLSEDHEEFPGMVMRTITKIGRLYDVSGVTYPAYEDTDVGVRSIATDTSEIDSVLTRAKGKEEDTIEDVVQRSEEMDSSVNNDDELLARLEERARRRQERNAR